MVQWLFDSIVLRGRHLGNLLTTAAINGVQEEKEEDDEQVDIKVRRRRWGRSQCGVRVDLDQKEKGKLTGSTASVCTKRKAVRESYGGGEGGDCCLELRQLRICIGGGGRAKWETVSSSVAQVLLLRHEERLYYSWNDAFRFLNIHVMLMDSHLGLFHEFFLSSYDMVLPPTRPFFILVLLLASPGYVYIYKGKAFLLCVSSCSTSSLPVRFIPLIFAASCLLLQEGRRRRRRTIQRVK